MFRLIKLAMYALVGYVLYELYQGMSAQAQQGGGGQRSSGGRAQGGRRQEVLTGGGEGRVEQTLDSDGASVPHRVGRGVRTM